MPVPATTRYVQGSPPAPFAASPSASQYYPSPHYTISSPSGSPASMTPPPFNHSRSLYACAPLPPLNGHIHPLLSAQGRYSLAFDVSSDPAYTLSSALSPRVLAEAATTPALPCVTVVSDIFPWRISVYPSSPKPGAFVTVADVLSGIYRSLRQQVRADDQDISFAPPHIMAAAHHAYNGRCMRDPSEQRKGMRRIDFLQGSHTFAGLLPTSENPDVWKLDFQCS